MPARFKADYVAKIKREVRRYQKERSKLIRKGVFENVPQQVSYRDLVSKYYTKREMNKRLKEMSLFTATKATKARTIRGKATTQYEIEQFRLTLGRQRKEVEREIRLIEKEPWNYARLRHDTYLEGLRSRRQELSRNWRELIGTRAGRSIMNYEGNREALYSNYIQALFQDAESLGLSQAQMEEMIAKLNTLTPRQFERMFNEDPDISYIFNYYNSLTDNNFEIEEKNAQLALQKIYSTLDQKIKYYKNI